MKKSISHSAKETRRLASELARDVLSRQPGKKARVLALQGELGAGKTTFVQAFAKALGVKEKVLSPTFLIVKKYKIQKTKSETNSKFQILNPKHFYHIDCYRLKSPKELLSLEWKEIISNPNNIVAVEWADKVTSVIPKETTWLSFVHAGEEKRQITISRPSRVR